jgi:hypothetical protein
MRKAPAACCNTSGRGRLIYSAMTEWAPRNHVDSIQ